MAKAELEILVDIDGATQELKGFARDASRNVQKVTKAVDGISSSFNALKAVAAAAIGAFAGKQIIDGISAVTEAASIQEDAVNALNTALATSGEFSEEASKDFQAFASGLQEVTRFGDEAILQQVAIAKAFGATNAQAKTVIEASIELAEATGKSLDESVRQVSKTLGGYAGELGEVNPQIKALTKEQLQAGKAAEILIKQYGGTAAARVKTFSGSVTQLSNTFGDLQEELGFIITDNPVVVDAIGELSKGLGRLIGFVKENRAEIARWVGEVTLAAVRAIPKVISGLKSVAQAVGGLGLLFSDLTTDVIKFIKAVGGIEFGVEIFDRLGTGVNLLAIPFLELINLAKQAREIATGGFITNPEHIQSLKQEMEELKGTFSVAWDTFLDGGEDVDEQIAELTQDINDFDGAVLDSAESAAGNISKITSALEDAEKVAEDAAKGIEDSISDIGKGAKPVTINVKPQIESLQGPDLTFGTSVTETDEKAAGAAKKIRADEAAQQASAASAVITTVIEGLKKGADGAVDVLAAGAGVVADAFLPGFGGAVQSLFSFLAQDSEALKQQIEGFVAAIPDVLVAVIENIPTLILALIDNFDELVVGLIRAAPRIARALIIELPKALADPELWRGMATAITFEVRDTLREELRNLATGFAIFQRIFADGLQSAVSGLITFFRDDLPPFLGTAIPNAINEGLTALDFTPVTDLGKDLADQFGAGLSGVAGEFINTLEEEIRGAFPSIGGGGGGDSGGFLGAVGLAEGGLVPPGFQNDSFPARLTSGEQVLSPGLTDKLTTFLQRQEQGMASIAAMASQGQGGGSQTIQLVLDGDVLSEAIVNQNRRNARLA